MAWFGIEINYGLCISQARIQYIFKPGMHRPHAWFLKLSFVRDVNYAYVYVCVRPQGYK